MTVRLSSLATEYVRVPFAAQDDGGALIDPTSYVVEFALVPAGAEPEAEDWEAGEWETSNPTTVTLAGRTVTTTHKARILAGPDGDLSTVDGRWRLWMRVEADPEVIVANVDEVVIT